MSQRAREFDVGCGFVIVATLTAIALALMSIYGGTAVAAKITACGAACASAGRQMKSWSTDGCACEDKKP